MRSPRELIRLQIEELWGRGRTELIGELYHPNVTDHMPLPGQEGGTDALAEVVETFHRAIPNLKIEVHRIIEDGAFACDHWTLTGTHGGELMGVPATGASLRFSGIDWIRAEDGRITNIWHAEELHLMKAQIEAGAGR